MLPWRMLWKAEALFLVLVVGCASIPRVPLVEDAGQGKAVVHVPRTADLQPVELEEEEFQQAVRRLAREVRLTGTPRQTAEKAFQMDPQSGNYLYLQREKKLVPAGPGEPWDGTLTKGELELAERYRLWCQSAYNFYGDCLGGALVGGRYLDTQGRYVWALAMSKSPVLDEMKKALGEMVEFRALVSAALWTLGSMLLIMLLNPVAPALVAALGVGMLLYVGYDTFRNLVTGWDELTKAAKVATTFEEIREAGERFGKIIGREAARAFAMLLVAAIGSTAQAFAAKVPTLPGSAQVAMQAEGQAGISLPALGAVEEARGHCRGREHHTARKCGGHGGAAQWWQGPLRRDAPHRHHLQRQGHQARRPVDAAIQGDLRQSRDDAGGPGEQDAPPGALRTAPGAVPPTRLQGTARRNAKLS